MSHSLEQFIGQPLRRVLYYRPQGDANIDLNWPGIHDVGLGVELTFDTGYFFVTWDNAAEEELSVYHGRMVDFLKEGIFEDISQHADWQAHIGQPMEAVHLLPNEAVVQIGGKQVFVITAEVDPDSLQIDGMADNLVVFFSPEARNAFYAQYPDTQTA
ncbi:hypothetical protein DEDE109153_12415 [Deinococcus deserti]|uniref:Uncharacterized protein n=1 Tax=Deinococcus deserti (strain DSM 17065 / CIP 109153 / LMG 22923 / VCD115) TaxID=546414 RepID=C1D2U3_DEIDV|nr:hypothetical protein [Deinococcus deserti]ACO47732.1 Hypothetical protein Deide_2p00700 [Deinococcus deserti VCD115]